MAIDFLIFALLLISFTINLLALGAFWVTPGLRTTANRFVINLLIINLIGCCILAPTLFFSEDISTKGYNSDKSLDIVSLENAADQYQLTVYRDQVIEQHESVNEVIRNGSKYSGTLWKCNSTYCERLTGPKPRDRIVMTQVNDKVIGNARVKNENASKTVESIPVMRCWSIDLAAALGALSVLLVVGDTWMAVRDPLRYHSRISGVKAWILITITWALGILFGIMSALRDINFECAKVIGKRKRYAPPEQAAVLSITTSTIFSMFFACIYFIVIILLPFGFVCGMYWRIFSEAKENGLRMRQNRSSPLHQSAINLSHNHQQEIMQRNPISNASVNAGLEDDHNENYIELSAAMPEANSEKLGMLSSPVNETSLIENKNVLFFSSKNEELKRKNNVRYTTFQAADRLQAIRQIHSAPNLQQLDHEHCNSFSSFNKNSRLRYIPQTALSIHSSSKTPSCMTSIRRRLSNASSLFKHREESRAARISILVVLMFLVSYLPYGVLVLLQDRVIQNFPHSIQLEVFMILLANLSSPFIFAYRNKRVRRGVIRLFGLDARSRERRQERKGVFLRYGNKASKSVKRSSSKVSAYSISSCKYLSPILRHANKKMKIRENYIYKADETFPTKIPAESNPSVHRIPILKNMTAVDPTIKRHPQHTRKKRSILKIICQSSPNLSCAAQSCRVEPTEV